MLTPFQSDLNLRFIAFLQHYEFRTRLIDTTHSPYIALYFACNDLKHIEEDGYVYKFFGLDVLSLASDIDHADVDSLFYNPAFPPEDHPLLYEPLPFLFYREINLYNIRARRQFGWFVFETEQYEANRTYNQKSIEIKASDKQQILSELRSHYNISNDYISADLSIIPKI